MTQRKKKFNSFFILAPIMFLGLLLYFGTNKDKRDFDKEETADEIIKKVENLVVLPNEKPSVATISDMNILKDHPFFLNAREGDKVLIYSQSKKAILYRPGIDKIIEIAPFSFDKEDVNDKQNN